jgi:hypothetical protein
MSRAKELTEKWALVVDRVAERTMKGNLEWEDTERTHVFQTSFPDYTIRIGKSPPSTGPDSTDEIVVTLHNRWGTAIGEISEREYADAGRSPQRLISTYEKARDMAFRVEQSLEDVLRYLES